MVYIEHSGSIELKPAPGSSFMYAANTAIALAKTHHKKTFFEFKGYIVQVYGHELATNVYSDFLKTVTNPSRNTVSNSIQQILNNK